MTRLTSPLHTQRGTSLLEVLVTIIILAIGLLGLAGLQARLQASEMEAYQRAQALILLNDMASRITANRPNAASYETGSDSPLDGADCPTSTATRQQDDASTWCNALGGAAETMGGGNVGAMVGGRGCVEALPDGSSYLVTVAWQGLSPVSAPAPACGKNLYNGAAGSTCAGDLCRRVLTTIVRIGKLK
ncbi:MAG: type IV pilus modification protein PilV [Burkholderiaceae bacterium]|nr:type IV pilus modification protein PilV [Burkholderiaceae bacterium]